jgi:hypothetical protein
MKKESPSEHNAVVASDGDAAEKAARLAPLEERAGQGSNNGGAITVGTAELKFPTEFTEREEKSRVFSIDPIAAVLLIFSLAFIAFIAYMISIEQPPQVTNEPSPAVEKQQ